MSRLTIALALGAVVSWAFPAAGYPGMGKAKKTGSAARAPSPPPAQGGAPKAASAGHSHDFGKVTGRAELRVTKPDGKPYPRAQAELLISVHGQAKGRLKARADARGRVVFRKVPLGEHATYTAAVKYQGVNYFAKLRFPPGKRSATGTLSVAAKTAKSDQLRIERAHLILDPSRNGIGVVEFMVINNPGKATYAAPNGIRIPLFHGATNLKARQATPGSFEMGGDHTLVFKGSLRPGKTQLQYSYDLPLQGTLRRATGLPIDKLSVILTRANFRLGGPSLRQVRKMSRNNVSFLVAEGGPVAAGAAFSFSIAPPKGMMAAARASAAGRPGGPDNKLVKDWRVVVKWLSPLVLLVIFFLVVYLAARRDDEHLALADEAALGAEKERLLAQLAKVTREAEGGNKAAARRREQLTVRLARVYRLLDQHAARRALHATPGSQPR